MTALLNVVVVGVWSLYCFISSSQLSSQHSITFVTQGIMMKIIIQRSSNCPGYISVCYMRNPKTNSELLLNILPLSLSVSIFLSICLSISRKVGETYNKSINQLVPWRPNLFSHSKQRQAFITSSITWHFISNKQSHPVPLNHLGRIVIRIHPIKCNLVFLE